MYRLYKHPVVDTKLLSNYKTTVVITDSSDTRS